MLGIRFIKFQPTNFILVYKSGKVVKEGPGLSFFYFSPTTSLVSIPLSSMDTPFIFEEVTSDFQKITLQGQVVSRIASPSKISEFLNFTLDSTGSRYISDDPEKLTQKVISRVQVLTKKEIQKMDLKTGLKSIEAMVHTIFEQLCGSSELSRFGLEILDFSLLAIKPTQETGRALEAQAREQILKEADDAIYERRNSALEQERKIKENELNTEIAVENKKREIIEAQMESERTVQEKKHQLAEKELLFQIQQEEERKQWVTLNNENIKSASDAKAYGIAANLRAYKELSPEVLEILTMGNMKPDQIIAQSFRELSEQAQKIGTLNITPELLNSLLQKNGKQ